jgi:hypothetical protein
MLSVIMLRCVMLNVVGSNSMVLAPFHSIVIFVCKIRSLPMSGEFTRVGSDLTLKHYTRLERPAMHKHYSLFCLFVSYDEEKL